MTEQQERIEWMIRRAYERMLLAEMGVYVQVEAQFAKSLQETGKKALGL